MGMTEYEFNIPQAIIGRPKVAVKVDFAPQITAPKLSDSPIHNHLWINNPVAFAPPRQLSNRPRFHWRLVRHSKPCLECYADRSKHCYALYEHE